MSKKKFLVKLLIGRGCRSDYPLTDPLIKKLENEDWCEYSLIQLEAGAFFESYKICKEQIKEKYDLVLIAGDRIEAFALSIFCLFNNLKTIHLGAGIINEKLATFDDFIRHPITLFSEIQLCEDRESLERVVSIFEILKMKSNIHIVGNPYIDDDLELDESLVPNDPYDLILYNPPTRFSELGNKTLITKELDLIIKMWKVNGKAIFLDSNPDPYNHFIMEYIISKNMNYEFKYNLPRPQFLGLLKRCERFITNSSASRYEAPFFLKKDQIIQIGNRNKNRSSNFNNMEKGASDKIVKILEEYYKNEKNQ